MAEESRDATRRGRDICGDALPPRHHAQVPLDAVAVRARERGSHPVLQPPAVRGFLHPCVAVSDTACRGGVTVPSQPQDELSCVGWCTMIHYV